VIEGQSLANFNLPESVAGTFVIVGYTATNTWTSVEGNSPVLRTSISTSRVTQTPVNTIAPAHSGSLEVGAVLSTNNGQWTSFPSSPSFQYSWFRCAEEQNLSGNLIGACQQITLANQSTYQLIPADLGKFVVARVTATIAPLAAGLVASSVAYTNSRGAIVEAEAQRISGGQSIWGANFLRMSIE
jgi:hypothetical protein